VVDRPAHELADWGTDALGFPREALEALVIEEYL
jgi:hypothetical protein